MISSFIQDMTYNIIQIRDECIGCNACADICPEYWFMDDDGLSTLKEGKENDDGNYELTLDKGRDCNEDAMDSCPVEIIIIEDL